VLPATSRSEPPRRYVALGDSFSAGAAGSDAPSFADLLADLLREANPRAGYHNLAVAGSCTGDVAAGQLLPAIALGPDVVTVVCGANDALLSVRPDVGAHAAGLERILATLRLALPGARLATATTPDPARFIGLRPRSAARVSAAIEAVNHATRTAARRYRVPLLDFAAHPEAGVRGNYDRDGYHPAPAASHRAAEAFAALLGIVLDRREAS
jgi:phosphatidylinositol alpha 1,6-mannosyltransferase